MKYTGPQIMGFVAAVVLALIAAVFLIDIAVRAVGYGATVLDSVVNREQPVVVTGEEAGARGESLLGIATETSDIPESYAAPAVAAPVSAATAAPKSTVTTQTQAQTQQKSASVAPSAPVPVPRYSNAVMSYHAFGTIWHGSFIPRTSITRNEIPAVRAMVYNNGNAATNAWTFSCNWEGSVTTTQQAPLGAGERAFAVCTTEVLSRGMHTVTLIYQEAGKPTQVQTVSVQVD